MFRRGRRHEAWTELSSSGVDEQPLGLPARGVEPERFLAAPTVTLLRDDSPRRPADQEVWPWWSGGSQAPSPLRGVPTEDVLAALGSAFSPAELDWELVGVAFVHWQPVQAFLDEPRDAAEPEPARPAQPAPARRARVAVPRKPRKWLREHDEIMAAVRDLSWEGYCSLIADIFRREGYEVFGGEGPDGDVIDMEVLRGTERMLVNCQIRGLDQIGVEPINEMVEVSGRSGADGVFIISDGHFAPEAWSLADGQALVLIDRDALLGLVLDFTLGHAQEKTLRAHMRRLLSGLQPRTTQWAS